MAILAVSISNADASGVFDTIFLIVCGKDYDFKDLARFSMRLILLLLISIILSSKLGLINDYVQETANRTRHYLGFRYALRASQFAFLITCLSIYLHDGVESLAKLVLLSFLNIYIFVYTDSRITFTLAAIAIFCGSALRTFLPKAMRIKPIAFVLISSFLIAAVVSTLVSKYYNPSNELMAYLDSSAVFAGRLTYGQIALERYGVSLLGQHIDLVGNSLDIYGNKQYLGEYFYIDCLYVKLLVQYGLIFFSIFVGGLTFCCYNAYKRSSYWLLLPLTLIATHCMIDDLSMYLCYNTFLFLLGRLMTGFYTPNRSKEGLWKHGSAHEMARVH